MYREERRERHWKLLIQGNAGTMPTGNDDQNHPCWRGVLERREMGIWHRKEESDWGLWIFSSSANIRNYQISIWRPSHPLAKSLQMAKKKNYLKIHSMYLLYPAKYFQICSRLALYSKAVTLRLGKIGQNWTGKTRGTNTKAMGLKTNKKKTPGDFVVYGNQQKNIDQLKRVSS